MAGADQVRPDGRAKAGDRGRADACPADQTDAYAFLAQLPAFRGVPADRCAEVVRALDGSRRSYAKGEVIKHPGDELGWFGIVRTGEVQAGVFDGAHDQIVERFGPGQIFGEAIALTGQVCPVQILATQDTEVVAVWVAPLFEGRMGSAAAPYVTQLLANLMQDMAKKLTLLNFKLRILREPRLRGRVMLYLGSLGAAPGEEALIPFTRAALADYLGVDRSALSRELGRMQDEGLIRLDGRKVAVLRAC